VQANQVVTGVLNLLGALIVFATFAIFRQDGAPWAPIMLLPIILLIVAAVKEWAD